jgi:hypothetical protein
MLKTHDLEEVLAVRPGCEYHLWETEPTSGHWWAVSLVPRTFPGPHHPVTLDGHSVEQFVVAICERRRDDGTWQWCHATPACKRIFGDLLLDNTTQRDTWFYVLEVEP